MENVGSRRPLLCRVYDFPEATTSSLTRDLQSSDALRTSRCARSQSVKGDGLRQPPRGLEKPQGQTAGAFRYFPLKLPQGSTFA